MPQVDTSPVIMPALGGLSMLRQVRFLAALVVLIGFGSRGFAHFAIDTHYYFFKDQRPLTLDTSRVAVFEAGDEMEDDGESAEVLRGLGLDVDQKSTMALGGWVLYPMLNDRTEPSAISATVAAVAKGSAVDFVSPVFVGDDGGPLVITPDILVQFSPTVSRDQASLILNSFGAGTVLEDEFGRMAHTFRVRCGRRDGFEVLSIANQLARRADVVFAEPDMIFTGNGSLIPNDPLFPNAWGLHNTGQSGGTVDVDMNGPQAWDVTLGDPSILVVIIDTGVEQDHPDINQVPGNDVTLSPSTTGDPQNACDNHGTAVAGCVSGIINNGLGALGIAPGCRIAAVRTFVSNTPCDGTWTTQTSSTVLALEWAESIGARVTNNSNGYGFSSSTIAQKYADTREAGMVHFASAGNEATNGVSYPASLASVQAIAAINRTGDLASFSNFGFQIALAAPGQDIITTDRTGSDGYVSGDYVSVNGTSFASPFTAGVAALIVSAEPIRSAFDVEAVLQETAVDMGSAVLFGAGRPDAFAAVTYDPCADIVPPSPEAAPFAKSRYISFVPGTSDQGPTAIRVRLMELLDPVPPYPKCCSPPDFSAHEGEVRWVAGLDECTDSIAEGTTFKCATLQCTPHYDTWDRILPGQTLHVTGGATLPSSLFEVSQIVEGCDPAIEANYTASMPVGTGRWADVAPPYHDREEPDATSEPSILDVVGVVDALKDVPGRVTHPLAHLRGDPPVPSMPLNVSDVTLAVDAVKLLPFPFSGPVLCE